jgi:1-acyl-sn-glycerol-3-phosphate acyltransferase
MGRRIAGGLRALWFTAAVTVSCFVLAIPVFAGIFTGLGRWTIPWGFRTWFGVWFRTAGIVPVVRGRENLARLDGGPAVLVGNHQSALDIPVLMLALDGNVRFLAKRSLFWIPIVGWVMKIAGFPAIDRGSARRTRPELDAALARIPRERNCWIIFPEGTRSRDGALQPYHRGTFNFARRAGVPVIPFAIDGARDLLPKGSLVPKPGELTLVFGEPVPAADVARLSPDELLERCRAFTEANLAALRAGA